jgi:hypothetical protein
MVKCSVFICRCSPSRYCEYNANEIFMGKKKWKDLKRRNPVPNVKFWSSLYEELEEEIEKELAMKRRNENVTKERDVQTDGGPEERDVQTDEGPEERNVRIDGGPEKIPESSVHPDRTLDSSGTDGSVLEEPVVPQQAAPSPSKGLENRKRPSFIGRVNRRRRSSDIQEYTSSEDEREARARDSQVRDEVRAEDRMDTGGLSGIDTDIELQDSTRDPPPPPPGFSRVPAVTNRERRRKQAPNHTARGCK